MEAAPNRRPHFRMGEGFRAALMRRYEKRWAAMREASALELEAVASGEWRRVRDLSRRHRLLFKRADDLWHAANPGWRQEMELKGRAAA